MSHELLVLDNNMKHFQLCDVSGKLLITCPLYCRQQIDRPEKRQSVRDSNRVQCSSTRSSYQTLIVKYCGFSSHHVLHYKFNVIALRIVNSLELDTNTLLIHKGIIRISRQQLWRQDNLAFNANLD